jgi:hypothetical protein
LRTEAKQATVRKKNSASTKSNIEDEDVFQGFRHPKYGEEATAVWHDRPADCDDRRTAPYVLSAESQMNHGSRRMTIDQY